MNKIITIRCDTCRKYDYGEKDKVFARHKDHTGIIISNKVKKLMHYPLR